MRLPTDGGNLSLPAEILICGHPNNLFPRSLYPPDFIRGPAQRRGQAGPRIKPVLSLSKSPGTDIVNFP